MQQLPCANPKLGRLTSQARLPEAPLLAVYWWDACFCSDERLVGEQAPADYKAGCPDVVVGFYLGTADGCILVGHSAYVRDGRETQYRHIWNIPLEVIIKVERLESSGAAASGT